jgi:hypothetical protein
MPKNHQGRHSVLPPDDAPLPDTHPRPLLAETGQLVDGNPAEWFVCGPCPMYQLVVGGRVYWQWPHGGWSELTERGILTGVRKGVPELLTQLKDRGGMT